MLALYYWISRRYNLQYDENEVGIRNRRPAARPRAQTGDSRILYGWIGCEPHHRRTGVFGLLSGRIRGLCLRSQGRVAGRFLGYLALLWCSQPRDRAGDGAWGAQSPRRGPGDFRERYCRTWRRAPEQTGWHDLVWTRGG